MALRRALWLRHPPHPPHPHFTHPSTPDLHQRRSMVWHNNLRNHNLYCIENARQFSCSVSIQTATNLISHKDFPQCDLDFSNPMIHSHLIHTQMCVDPAEDYGGTRRGDSRLAKIVSTIPSIASLHMLWLPNLSPTIIALMLHFYSFSSARMLNVIEKGIFVKQIYNIIPVRIDEG